MKHHRGWGYRGALLAAVVGTFTLAEAAAAQNAAGGETPGAALRRQLVELAADPTSVAELVETGRAALDVGDGEAALGFFTRANQLAPRDMRVKAGLAAANVRSGRPHTALLLFSEVVALGTPEAEIAAERGLAYDLLGQTARAQQDYVLSLRRREDPEVRRRLALSLAISGQRDAALKLIDPLARQGDRAAHRARVMVLALTGDVAGAGNAARASLPAEAAQAVAGFLPRLAALSPGQMAAAANLGRVPGNRGYQQASRRAAVAPYPGALAFAGVSGTAVPAAAATASASTTVRRRPGVNGAAEAVRQRPVRTAGRAPLTATETARPRLDWTTASSSAVPARVTPQASAAAEAPALLQPHPFEPLRMAGAAGKAAARAIPAAGASTSAPIEQASVSSSSVGGAVQAELPKEAALVPTAAAGQPAASQPVQLALASPSGVSALSMQSGSVAPVASPAANQAAWSLASVSTAAATTSETERPAFSDVVAMVSSLPTEAAATPAAAAERSSSDRAAETRPDSAARSSSSRNSSARTASTRTASARTTSTRSAAAAKPAPAREAHPSRIWVQIGVSPNRSAFGFEINRMRRAAPDLLKGKTAHAAPIGSSHRLLVGPFASNGEARTFVNGLKQKDIEALAWTSPAGTEVERVAGGR